MVSLSFWVDLAMFFLHGWRSMTFFNYPCLNWCVVTPCTSVNHVETMLWERQKPIWFSSPWLSCDWIAFFCSWQVRKRHERPDEIRTKDNLSSAPKNWFQFVAVIKIIEKTIWIDLSGIQVARLKRRKKTWTAWFVKERKGLIDYSEKNAFFPREIWNLHMCNTHGQY